MLKKLKNKAGLVLAEALLAIAMLTVGAIVTGTLINIAISTTILSKNYLLAQNMATEGIEAVKSIRNANWLNKPNSPDCWLTIDASISEDVCTQAANKVAASEKYRIVPKADGTWEMQSASANIDLDLKAYDPVMAQYRLYWDTDPNKDYERYVALEDYNSIPTLDQAETTFYRNVKFVAATAETATFEVNVQWKEGQKVRSIQRTIIIYNY